MLNEPDVLAATERIAGFHKAHDSTGAAGYANNGLFATYHLIENVPHRSDWEDLNRIGAGLLTTRGKPLIEALGFKATPASGSAVLLSTSTDASRAVAVLLDDTEQFDSTSSRFQLSPVAYGLAVAAQQEVPWLVVIRKDQIRLYPGRDGVGVGSKGQSETYFEIDLATLEDSYAGLLPLIFTAEALSPGGTTEQLLDESTRYATELGERLRERIYDDIIPPLAIEVASQLAKHTSLRLDTEGLATAYRVTLRILFRLLFQAYAEDRGLLPSGRNESFDANSLKTNAQRLIAIADDDFGEAATLWRDLTQVWDAIDKGNSQWQIPAYNGGLFSSDADRSPDGALFTKIQIPDRALGPALKHLLIDTTRDGVDGQVDFRSLSVREFGTIYEGLLESSLSKAEQDLTLNRKKAWVPAQTGDEVQVSAGNVYFHTASGERKATGSYFTPKVVVDHLIDHSLVPQIKAHLDRIAALLAKGDSAAATREFFNFRVADLAMGSGHFLIAAVDKIEALMRTFLAEHAVPGVTDELLRLASVAKSTLGSDDVAKSEVDKIGLLRRQVARRCIYGLDTNSMAVELARLALWIHTFVPGLPMSNLDHGLVNANSLTGIGTVEEALDILHPDRAPDQAGFFDDVINDTLASAKTLLTDLANAGEANKAEIEKSAKLLEQAREAASPAQRIFDVAVAARVGAIKPGLLFTEAEVHTLATRREVAETVELLKPAHMPVLFPEVFLRDNPGFDVVLGNPPWEKLQIEEHSFFSLSYPGLRGMTQAAAETKLEDIRRDRPDLVREYDTATESTKLAQRVLAKGPYPGITAGRPDLYKAFAWRMWQLVRTDGWVGAVLPRKALEASGMKDWRLTVLTQGTFNDVTVLANTGGWVFEGIDGRITVAVVSIQADRGSREKTLSVRGPYASKAEMLEGKGQQLSPIRVTDLLKWSKNGAFPLLPDATSLEAFLTLRSSPRLDTEDDNMSVRGLREWNATDDKHRFILTDEPEGLIPVYKGDSFDLWNPSTGSVYAYADPVRMKKELQERRLNQRKNRRSAFYGMPDDWTFDLATLPMHHPRVAWRDTTNRTNSRTLIAALVPPEVVMVHQAYYLFFRKGTASDQAYVLGVLSSIPFDWYSRQTVETHATIEFLLGAPLPRPTRDNPLRLRVVQIAGRLAAVDERYAEWADAAGVPVGTVKTQAQKDDLIAELDGLVSLLYGLSEDQVEQIFATFHRGWKYQPRLEAVLEHYARWKDKA